MNGKFQLYSKKSNENTYYPVKPEPGVIGYTVWFLKEENAIAKCKELNEVFKSEGYEFIVVKVWF